MRKRTAMLAGCALLSALLAGCMGETALSGATINDMLLPAAGTDDSLASLTGVTVVGTQETETAEQPKPAQEAFAASPALKSCMLNISLTLRETFKNETNAFSVPITVSGAGKMQYDPEVRMDLGIDSTTVVNGEEVKYGVGLYVEQAGEDWTAYSNSTGKWAKTALDGEKASGIAVTGEEWDTLAAAFANAEADGTANVDGVSATRYNARVAARTVAALFGSQLGYVVPGVKDIPNDDKLLDTKLDASVWLSEDNQLLKITFDASPAFEKAVIASFEQKSTKEFKTSAQDVSLTITVTSLNAVKNFEIPADVKGGGAAPSPTATKTPGTAA